MIWEHHTFIWKLYFKARNKNTFILKRAALGGQSSFIQELVKICKREIRARERLMTGSMHLSPFTSGTNHHQSFIPKPPVQSMCRYYWITTVTLPDATTDSSCVFCCFSGGTRHFVLGKGGRGGKYRFCFARKEAIPKKKKKRKKSQVLLLIPRQYILPSTKCILYVVCSSKIFYSMYVLIGVFVWFLPWFLGIYIYILRYHAK